MRQPVVSAALFNWIETDECKSYIEIQDIKKQKNAFQICKYAKKVVILQPKS